MFFNKKNKLKTWEKMASENEEAGELSLNLLPEGCIANVLSFTSPLAACCLLSLHCSGRPQKLVPFGRDSCPVISSPNLIVLCWFLPRNNSISASVAILSSLRMVKRFQFSSQSQIWQHIK